MKMIKKFGKRSLATILAFMMCLGLMATTAFAASSGTTFSFGVVNEGDTTVDVSATDEDRYIDFVLLLYSTRTDVVYDYDHNSIGVKFDVPAPLQITDISSTVRSTIPNKYPMSENIDVENGTAVWRNTASDSVWSSCLQTDSTEVVRMTVKVPADTPTGNYDVTLVKWDAVFIITVDGVFEDDYGCGGIENTFGPLTETISVIGKTAPVTVTYGEESANLTTADTVTINPAGAENFSLDGATEEKGIYTLALTGDVTLPTNLTKNGFTFTGWSYDSTNKTFTAGWEENEPAPQPADYTVTLTEADSKTAVAPGDEITVNVTVTGGDFSAAVVPVTYDTERFTYTGDLQAQNGIILVQVSEGTEGDMIAQLPFTAKNVDSDETATFSATSDCKVTPLEVAENDVAVSATTTVAPLTLDWSSEYEVQFVGKDNAVIDTQNVGYNGYATAPTDEIAAPDHMEFDYWAVNGEKVNVSEYPITAATTFTAVFKYTEYTVTLGDGMDKSAGETVTATYDQPLEVKIADYDAENNSYTIKVGDTVVEDPSIAADGTVTLPTGTITGDVTVSATPAANFTVTVSKYVTDHTLVLVKVGEEGTKTTKGFSYGGNQMYYVEAYKAYAWIVKGEVSEESAKAAVAIGDGTGGTIEPTNDVNPDGKVDVGDVGVVYSCYKAANDATVNNMKTYLRADIDGDKKVDTDDVAALQQTDAYKAYLAGLFGNS